MNENKKNIFKEITKWLLIICTTFVLVTASSLIYVSGVMFGASHHEEINDLAESVFDNHGSTKKEAKRLAAETNTSVPNSGYVEKLYFNTNLTVNEVLDIFQSLTFIETPFISYPLYPILISDDMNPIVAIFYDDNEDSEDSYFLSVVEDMNSFIAYNIFNYNNGNYNDGWSYSFSYIGKTILSEFSGLPVGTENNLLSNFVSTVPFEGVNYNDYQGKPVASSGSIGTVYFNTKLSIDEVVYYLQDLYLGPMGFPLFGSLSSGMLAIDEVDGVYIIGITGGNFGTIPIFSSGDADIGIIGWNTDIPVYVFENISFESAEGVGVQNAFLVNLISSVPFLYQVGNNVPTSGYVDTVYFNTSLSTDEVDSYLSKFQYSATLVDLVDVEVLFFSEEGKILAFRKDSVDSYSIIFIDYFLSDPMKLIYNSEQGFIYDSQVIQDYNILTIYAAAVPDVNIINNFVDNIVSTSVFVIVEPSLFKLFFEDLRFVVLESLDLLSEFAVDLKYVFYDFENNELTIVGLFFALSLTFGVITALFALIRNLMVGRR